MQALIKRCNLPQTRSKSDLKKESYRNPKIKILTIKSVDAAINFLYILRAISGIVHAHHSAAGNGENCLGPVFRPFSNSHQYRFQIRLRLVDISAFSGQNKLTKIIRNIYGPVIINDRLSTKY